MDFSTILINCTAPTLCGIKPSCLFSLDADNYNKNYNLILKLKKDLNSLNKKLIIINKKPNLYLVFVYDSLLLFTYLNSYVNLLYLISKGYVINKNKEYLIAQLLSRLKNSKEFPHEVGIFLGYPLKDVVNFEKDKGKTSLYSGLWQVYDNTEQAILLMQRYKTCTRLCLDQLNKGISIPNIIEGFNLMEANK